MWSCLAGCEEWNKNISKSEGEPQPSKANRTQRTLGSARRTRGPPGTPVRAHFGPNREWKWQCLRQTRWQSWFEGLAQTHPGCWHYEKRLLRGIRAQREVRTAPAPGPRAPDNKPLPPPTVCAAATSPTWCLLFLGRPVESVGRIARGSSSGGWWAPFRALLGPRAASGRSRRGRAPISDGLRDARQAFPWVGRFKSHLRLIWFEFLFKNGLVDKLKVLLIILEEGCGIRVGYFVPERFVVVVKMPWVFLVYWFI